MICEYLEQINLNIFNNYFCKILEQKLDDEITRQLSACSLNSSCSLNSFSLPKWQRGWRCCNREKLTDARMMARSSAF